MLLGSLAAGSPFASALIRSADGCRARSTTGLGSCDSWQGARLNHELYGFTGVSVRGANIAFPRKPLESTKLVKFECYAEFTVTDAIRLRR
jgi:hypothetical protein